MRLPCLLAALTVAAAPAGAHFGMIVPSDTMVSSDEAREIAIRVGFAHPFEPSGMDIGGVERMTVTTETGTEDITGTLSAADFHGAPGFEATLRLERPGTHILAMTPEPYWEPAEDAFILHHTKTYLSAFDDDAGWQTTVGLPVEIEPLSRPFGIWEGNVFRGRVLRDGAPVPFAEVEVEHYAPEGGVAAPSELMVTQTIVADGDGVFTYAPPAAGWWGFAALMTAQETMEFEGTPKAVELGAVIWVRFEAWGAE